MPTKTRDESAAEVAAGTRRGFATVQDVADYFSVAKQTVYGWRKRGEGPKATKVGRLVRYKWEDVEKWASEQPVA